MNWSYPVRAANSAISSAWARACRSDPQMPHRDTLISTCPRPGVGVGNSSTENLVLVTTAALIDELLGSAARGGLEASLCRHPTAAFVESSENRTSGSDSCLC